MCSSSLGVFSFNLNTESMKFLEKDLEDIIWESDNELLQERGMDISGKKIRQLRIGNFGIADLITYKKDYYRDEMGGICSYLDITVYELKKEKIGISAFLQSIRYCKGIKTYLESKKQGIEFSLNIVLCGKDIDLSGDFVFITDLFSGFGKLGNISTIDFYTYNYKIDGIDFKFKCDYNLTDKGF